MSRHDVSLVLSTYLSDDYIEQYYGNVVDLIGVANIQLVHVLNDPTELELLFVDKFNELQLREGRRVFEYKYLIVKRETLYASWNRAIKLSDAELISISNVDDVRYPQGLRGQIDAFNGCDGLLLLGSKFYVRTEGGLQSTWIKQLPTRLDLISGMYIGPFFIWKNPRLLNMPHIMFDEQFRVAGDFDFQIRFSSIGKIGVLNEYVGEYLNIGNGLSTGSILQEIEGQLIYLRYNVVDKLIPFSSLLCLKYGYSANSFSIDGGVADISEVVIDLNLIRQLNSVRVVVFKERLKGLFKTFKIAAKSVFYA